MITAVILTKNEGKNIETCIKSLQWCSEVVVLDDYSVDNTVAIAKKLGAKVIKEKLHNDFSMQRNIALSFVSNEWVLFVDADEEVSRILADEIKKKILTENEINGYYIKRQDTLWNKKLHFGENKDAWLLRLGKTGKGKWKGKVHETWEIKSPVGYLENVLDHYPHQTIKEFFEEINFYTTLRSEELYNNKIKTSWLQILFYTKGKFFQNYIIKLGFFDGIRGFISAVIMAYHSYLVRAKLWLLWNKK
ncbi:MAG TPA: glycosyltransferase family 2 protein [Patescibacteria group bacterium]